MPTEQQIRELAYAIWEQEGRPDGKDQEHYFRAKQILDEKEKPPLVQLTSAPSGMRLTTPPPARQLGSPPNKRGTAARRKKS